MECQTVERLGRLEKHWEHVGSEGVKCVDVWMWVVERVGSECKHVGLEYERVGSANEIEHVGSGNEVEYQGSENDEYQNSKGE